MLYLRSAKVLKDYSKRWMIRRFNRKGRLVPFEGVGEFVESNAKKEITAWNALATSFDVGPDGKIYVIGRVDQRKVKKCHLDMYGADGKLLKKGLVEMTDSPGCVRADHAGGLYVADSLRPAAKEFPSFYSSDPRKHLGKWYGTLFRFGPEGGSILLSDKKQTKYLARHNKPVDVKGAIWGFYGVSPMPQQANCQCMTADFDADDWGRCWVPDVPGHCVTVVDAAGNVMMRFGGYGNWDAKGAGSKTPEPLIPFWSADRVAVSDVHVYVLDSYSRRIVQVRLVYAMEKVLKVR